MTREIKILASIGVVVVLGFVLFFFGQQRANQSASTGGTGASAEIARLPDTLLVRADAKTQGPTTARVKIVEFLDPECEACRAMHPIVKQLMTEYDGQVLLIVRYMPYHPNSVLAASVLEAAHEQGKYWETLAALFERQPEWGDHHNPQPEMIWTIAGTTGLDLAKLRETVKQNEETYKALIEKDRQDGESAGVRGTPTFFVNGRMATELGYEALKELIRQEIGGPIL